MRRRLDAELVRRGLVDSRSRAAEVIAAGRVTVGGAPAGSPARQVDEGEPVVVAGDPPRYVSRGGLKLEAALHRFGVEVAGERCLDAGASTGGFTDCLLRHGAAEVVAVDVGRGQLAWSLREDPRVTVLERINVRALDPLAIGEPVKVLTADLSFISLGLVAPALAAVARDDADGLLLVKPQFEAGRARVGKGGIVRDPEVHRDVLRRVTAALGESGLPATDVMPSPVRGADGNIEFMVHTKRGSPPTTAGLLDAVVGEAHAHPAVVGNG